MNTKQPYITLNSGFKIPALGLGTFLSPQHEVEAAVEHAIDAGYRHIDCAALYGNESEVGDALKKKICSGVVKREEMFITSKLWCTCHRPEDVRTACEQSLKSLSLSYLDLYLIHWPVSFKITPGKTFSKDDPSTVVHEDIPLEETWKAMERLVEDGLVRSIGVSNFNKTQIERILKICQIKPAINQIEVHINWLNTRMIEYAHANKIDVTAYAPFGSPVFVGNSAVPSPLCDGFVISIAKAHNKTTAQVLIRHALQRGLIVIPKSTNPERIKSNFDIFDFALTEEEMKILNTHGRNIRLFDIPSIKSLPEYPFHDEY